MTIRNRPAAPRLRSRRSARYGRLLKVCRARGCSLEDAKDVVQEAHARLLEYLRSATVKDPDAILRRIVINLSINQYHLRLEAPAFEDFKSADRRGLLIDPAAGPERTLAAQQELDGVVRLLGVASPRASQIFIAQRGGYSYEEIAAAFALKPRTVEKHVATAMETLNEFINRGQGRTRGIP